MAFRGEIYVEGPDGEVEGPRPNKTSLIFEFNHEVFLPFDVEQNIVQGSRRLGAFTITKEIDRMTPILYKYCCEGATLPKVTIILYKIKEGQGSESPYFNFTLETTRIVSVKSRMPTTKEKKNENVGHLEEVQFLSESFTWNNEPTDEEGRGEGDPAYTEVKF